MRARVAFVALVALICMAAAQEKTLSMSHGTGTFEVKLMPQPPAENSDPLLSRMSLDKQFHGDLEGTSKGEMLFARTGVKELGGYVAIEKVSGKLAGRSGTSVLQHKGVMQVATQHLDISVVPDSGTGELTGLTGTMNIVNNDGKHSYTFDYSLPEAQQPSKKP